MSNDYLVIACVFQNNSVRKHVSIFMPPIDNENRLIFTELYIFKNICILLRGPDLSWTYIMYVQERAGMYDTCMPFFLV